MVLEKVRVRYRPQDAAALEVDHLSIDVGEQVAVIGPSGSGKTTLLRLINGYAKLEAGEVRVLGNGIHSTTSRSVQSRRRGLRLQVGIIFQDFNLIGRASVFDNVLWGRLGRLNPLLSSLGWFPGADKRVALRSLDEVGLLAQADRRADSLSGGQQQRVGVARVLAQEAEILLADEPVSSLDPALAGDILGLLTAVSRRHGATLLMSLHQPRLAVRYAQRIVGLQEGRVVWDGAAAALDDDAVCTIYDRRLELNVP